MAPFTPKEISRAIFIGIAALLLGIVMTSTGAICLARNVGVPEYITSLRNTGWTLIALSALWISLAMFRKLTVQ